MKKIIFLTSDAKGETTDGEYKFLNEDLYNAILNMAEALEKVDSE